MPEIKFIKLFDQNLYDNTMKDVFKNLTMDLDE
jgi:hypothetical protein